MTVVVCGHVHMSEGIRSSGAGDGCEPPDVGTGKYSGPLEEQQVF